LVFRSVGGFAIIQVSISLETSTNHFKQKSMRTVNSFGLFFYPLGHASVRTTQIYGRILPKLISKEMATLRAKLLDINASANEEIKTGSYSP
jgi:alkyl hydroperoxide reductase subunit AhpC